MTTFVKVAAVLTVATVVKPTSAQGAEPSRFDVAFATYPGGTNFDLVGGPTIYLSDPNSTKHCDTAVVRFTPTKP